MATAREVAMLTLAACERQGAWSDGHLKKAIRQAELDRRDAALASRLCFGVLQNRLLLDHYIQAFSKVKLEKLELKVLCTLRVALYQLLFLDKIPESAAVNEAVTMAKKHSRNPRSGGLVNAILRALLREKETLPPVTGKDELDRLSVQHSHPRWLVELFHDELDGTDLEQLLQADNEQPPTTAQVNVLRADREEAAAMLAQESVEVEHHPWLDQCLTLTATGDMERLTAYQNGLFYIQDTASRLAVRASGVKPGDKVLDVCAAPGGKSFAAAIQMENQGSVTSCDIHPHKIGLIEAGRDRLGLSCITAREQNAKLHVQEWEEAFDVVLTDVPCSGLGIIRKKPDIRFKNPKPLAGLPKIQREILDNASTYVKPGGVLLYSTCTLLRRENQDVVNAFLRDHPDFALETFTLPQPVGECRGMVTLWPHRHGTDGFFFAKLRRQIHD